MGDRALVVFTDGSEVSPITYLHWAGSKVPKLLEQLKVLMASRGADVSYASARFFGICHMQRPEDNMSLGAMNTDDKVIDAVKSNDSAVLTEESHGDAGFIVVNVNDYSWKAYGGYLGKEEAA